MTDNRRYFVKSHFNGWQEVDEEHYNNFIKIIQNGATALNDTQKEQYIKQKTFKYEAPRGGGKSRP